MFVDIAVDPLEGTNLVATGSANRDRRPRRGRARRPHARPRHLPREAHRWTDGDRDRSRSPTRSRSTLTTIAERLGRKIWDITVVILDRPRHQQLIAEVRAAGARIRLIGDGDLSAAISVAVSGSGVHAVMGIGGAPEGVISAAAMHCLDGEIQARF